VTACRFFNRDIITASIDESPRPRVQAHPRLGGYPEDLKPASFALKLAAIPHDSSTPCLNQVSACGLDSLLDERESGTRMAVVRSTRFHEDLSYPEALSGF